MDFLWSNVGKDCIFIGTHCKACHIKRIWFMPELLLRATSKPKVFLKGCSIALIINMELGSLEGYYHYIVAIDCFF